MSAVRAVPRGGHSGVCVELGGGEPAVVADDVVVVIGVGVDEDREIVGLLQVPNSRDGDVLVVVYKIVSRTVGNEIKSIDAQRTAEKRVSASNEKVELILSCKSGAPAGSPRMTLSPLFQETPPCVVIITYRW